MDMRKVFGPEGPFSRAFPAYEHREEQIRMADAIQFALNRKRHVMVEAGTGVGKSFAYLAPIIEWAMANDKRVIVSTNTKTLQHQLIDKDLPLLKKILNVPGLRYALCVGSENYVCHRRLEGAHRMPGNLFDQIGLLDKLYEWGKATTTGLRSEIRFQVPPAVWKEVARIPDLCMNQFSPFHKVCRFQEARRSWQTAHVLVVNHHLFFSNLKADGKVLPTYDAVLFDEAHNVEEVAASHLGVRVSRLGYEGVLHSLFGASRGGVIQKAGVIPATLMDEIEKHVGELLREGEVIFGPLAEVFRPGTDKKRYRNPFDHIPLPHRQFNALSNALDRARSHIQEMEKMLEVNSAIERYNSLVSDLEVVLRLTADDAVYWGECRSVRTDNHPQPVADVCLNMAPLNIGELMDSQVYARIKPAMFVSATLTTAGDFSFMRRRLGLKDSDEILLHSPFDYKKNVLLLTDSKAPEPTARGVPGEPSPFARYIVNQIAAIVPALTGGAFVLFTSYRLMDEVFELVRKDYQDNWCRRIPVLERSRIEFMKQGDIGRELILERFRKAGRAILFATKTFWEGVDVPGDALQCVILTRMPFAVPDDPIVEARVERINRQGGNAFFDYQVPEAVMQFRQGFGRLIRKADDIGVVAVLDSRIKTKGYGKQFLASVPACVLSENPADVKPFIQEAIALRNPA